MDFLLDHLAKIDNPPSPQEISEITQFKQVCTTHIADLQVQIDELEARIANLREDQQAWEDKGRRCDSITSSIRRFPPEVLCQIFIQCIPTLPEQLSFDCTVAPMLLCHICQRWREVALECSELWRSVWVKLDWVQATEGVSDLLNIWGRRAKGVPLSLGILSRGGYSPKFLWESLIPNPTEISFRIGQLSLRNMLPEMVHNIPENSFPFLENLSLNSSRSIMPSGVEITTIPSTCFEDAPRLRRVYVKEPIYSAVTPMRLPWSQLTHLLFDDAVHPNFWVTIFPCCVNLRRAMFTFRETNAAVLPPARSTVELPNLIELIIDFYYSMQFPNAPLYPTIFSYTKLPSLSNLRIKVDVFNPYEWPKTWRLQFYGALKCLKKLSLELTRARYPLDYLNLLAELPQLEELHIDMRLEDLREIFDYLHFTTIPEMRLPRLHTVHISIPVVHRCIYETLLISDFDEFKNFVKSRWAQAPLKRIVFYLSDCYSREKVMRIRDALEVFILMGLKVDIRKDRHIWSHRVVEWADWSDVPE